MIQLHNKLRRLIRDERGDSVAESAALVALLAVIVSSVIASGGPVPLFGRIQNSIAQFDPSSTAANTDESDGTQVVTQMPSPHSRALTSVLAIACTLVFARWLQVERK